MVMKGLKELDHIAYIRFASVYREFADITALKQELDTLIGDETAKESRPTSQLPLLSVEPSLVLAGGHRRHRK